MTKSCAVPASSAERLATYRARRREAGEPDTTRRNRKNERKAYKSRKRDGLSARPFCGCDGEGANTDDLGRQLFMLFRMGERELFTGKPLSTWELLDFICGHPSGQILVGFAFGYDVTMILRDLPEKQARRLFENKERGAGHSPFVWYKEFDIDYLPKNYFRVRRVRIERDNDGNERRVAIKGSTRTIWETFGFFQKSFLKSIESFDIGSEEQRLSIAINKARRSDFVTIDQTERDYCAMECDFLAQLMEKLREYCYAADIRPKTWSGAGKLAAALHSQHETLRGDFVRATVPPEVVDLANMAYYGGRFEISRAGSIKKKVYEYDIRSAYPAAMPDLPCLVHGSWKKADASEIRQHKGLFVSGASWKPRKNVAAPNFGGLPVRSKEGHLYWPLRGNGIYWSVEIESAKRLGFDVTLREGWTYHCRCDCKPFAWVEPLFDYRRSIGSSGPGYPIKLGINALYGMLAQRIGKAAFANMIWAGLITAITRAKLNDAIALDPLNILMLATDALYSLQPLDLPLGDRLGQWEQNILDGLFIVQPGLYWCPELRKRKSRGLSGKFFEEKGRTESFEQAWRDYEAAENSQLEPDYPAVSVPVPGFVGLKLALARGRPLLAGTWTNDSRLISFDYTNKRAHHTWRDGHILLGPKAGSAGLVSLPHREFLKAGGHEPWEAARAMLDDQPDYVDFGIPFK